MTLILLGLFLNRFPRFDFHSMRIPSVLARLEIVYFFATIIYLVVKKNLKNDKYIIGSLIISSLVIILGYKSKNEYYKVLNIIVFALVGFIGASLFNKVIPYNKMIWTSSFVLITAAVAALSLALLYLICDIYKKENLLKPFIFLGSSPIYVYLVSELIIKNSLESSYFGWSI